MKNLIRSLVLLSSTILIAQDSFTITNVTVFNGQEVLENTNVTVVNGEIYDVGSNMSKEGTIIDGTGKFLMPAMTNSHVHAFTQLGLVQAAQAGVLNLFDMHGLETMQGALKDQKDNSSLARLYTAGYAATAPGGHGTQYGFPVPTLEKPEDAAGWVADRVDAGVDHIKIIIEPWRNTISHETAKAIIEAAHQKDKVAVVHISKVDDAYKVLMNNADGLVHLWWDKAMDEEKLKAVASNDGIFVIPTILTSVLIQANFGKTEAEIDAVKTMMLSEVKRLYEAGVTILAGTDPPNANINMGTDLYKELAYFVEAGLPMIEVLKSATSYPMEKFNIEKQGFIKAGYKADLLLLTKSPLAHIENLSTIEHIWKSGILVEK